MRMRILNRTLLTVIAIGAMSQTTHAEGMTAFQLIKEGNRYVGEESTRGNYPRSFAFDPTGEFLYCCNQRSDNVTGFRVDRATGGLRFTGQYTPVGNPSCVVFVELNKTL